MNSSRSSLTDQVQRELERLILSGGLKPGEHVKERNLASQLGVSRGPVREACRALQRAGLVQIIPHRGVFVREVDLHSATDLYDIRAELAGIVAREAVHNLSPKSARVLADLIERMDRAASQDDVEIYLELNLEFHSTLYALADNQRIVALDRALGNELSIYRRHALASGRGLEISNREHRGILTALMEGNTKKLERLLKRHITGGKHRYLVAIGDEEPGEAMLSLDMP